MAEERFDLVLELLTDLQAGLRDFRQDVDARFDKVDARFDRVESRLDKVESRLDGMESRLDGVESHLDHIDGRLDRIEVRLDHLDARMDALEALVRQLARRVDGITIDLAALKREAASLRQAITDYHGSVLGHGVLLTELEERLARVERHLDLRS